MSSPFPSCRQGSNRGFTLVEMILTMVVLLLLSAAIFEILTGVLQSASALQDNQNRQDQVTAFKAFLKTKLSGLSAESTLSSYRRGDGEGLTQNGIIFGDDALSTAIDAKIQPNGYYTLRLATFSPSSTQQGQGLSTFLQAITNDDPSLNWAPLVRDVKVVSWKFQDLNATEWLDLWNNPATKPNLIEFTMQQAGDLQPTTMDYWIPRLQTPAAAATTP